MVNLTTAELLVVMRRGQNYTASQLARLLGGRPATVRDVLHLLLEQGEVDVVGGTRQTAVFRRASGASRPVAIGPATQNLTPTIATFPVTRNVRGDLRGYEAELVSLRALAMIARDRSR